MNREKLGWMISLMLIVVLVLQIPGSLAQRDDDYAFVRTLIDIHRHVATNYVEPVDETKLRHGAIEGMLAELDPFSIYVPEEKQEDFDMMLEGSFRGVGVFLNQLEDGRIEVVSPIDESPAAKAGVMAGDVVLKVNGEDIAGLRLPEVIGKVKGKTGSEVKLYVRRVTGEEKELTMTRQEVAAPTVKGYCRKTDNSWDYYVTENPKIAYVRITQFTSETYDRLRPVIENLLNDGMKGLIMDLRFNPGGQLQQAEKIVDMFIESGVIVKTKGRNRPESVRNATGANTLPNFPLIVLVNEHSASASEIVAGALSDNNRALVVGTRSYGKGSVQEVVPLDGHAGELKLTVAYYYLPSGRCVHRIKDAKEWGVEPKIIVPMDQPAQAKLFKTMQQMENFRRPNDKKASTRPTTITQADNADPQLQAAVTTMLGVLIFQGKGPTTAPTTEPTTQEAIAPVAPTTVPVAPVAPGEIVPTTVPAEIPATAPATQPGE